MAGKMIGTTVMMAFLTFIVMLIIFFFVQVEVKSEVNDINYDVVNIVATRGIFTQDLYDYLMSSIRNYGSYKVTMKLEKQIAKDEFDRYFHPSDILNQKLRIGDRLTIYVEGVEPTLFGRLINATFLFIKPEKWVDTRIKSLKTALIANNADSD